jgi:sugar phosphate isomerase/epimerase
MLTTLAAGFGAVTLAPKLAAQKEIKTTLNGPVGLQLWSLREYLPKDLRGTLAKVRALGFREVEAAGLWGATLPTMRAALDEAGLRCRSAHIGFDRLRDDAAGAIVEAKGLGAAWVVCAWIPHQKTFGREDALKAADVFNTFSAAGSKEGLRFAYHCHGYEFVPSPDGTLFETFANAADPARVAIQVDVFHAYHGGTDPVKLIERYKGRVTSLHLKDMKKGMPVKAGTATGTPEEDVPVGTGQIDMAAVLRTAMKTGVSLYYIEDESADPWGHIPQSVAYLEKFK